MADPKFANLPGIAYDESDVYETPDIPEEDTSDYFEDVNTIERLHFASEESNNKFKGKYLTGNVEYSHNNVGACWELAAQGEKESPIERYQRIKCEMDELMNELLTANTLTQVKKKDKQSYESIGMTVSGAQKVLGSLKLENVIGTETVLSASDNEIKKLIAQVNEFRTTDRSKEIPSEINQNQLEHTKRIADLEARLYRIEKIIGNQQQDKLNRLSSALNTNDTLVDSVQQISTKAALLQPTQLDHIEARILALTAKLDAINTKAAMITGKSNTSDVAKKIEQLFNIAKKIEPISKLLPDILQRMQSLETLHNHANNFNKTINELESTQSSLVSHLNSNKMQLQNVQETFAMNLESVNQEVGKLESKLKTFENK